MTWEGWTAWLVVAGFAVLTLWLVRRAGAGG
jgi:hypothetical protein